MMVDGVLVACYVRLVGWVLVEREVAAAADGNGTNGSPPGIAWLLLARMDDFRSQMVDLRSEVGGVKGELIGLRTELRSEVQRLDAKIDDVSAGLNAKIDDVSSSLNAKIDGVSAGLNANIDGVASGVVGARYWSVGILVTLIALVLRTFLPL